MRSFNLTMYALVVSTIIGSLSSCTPSPEVPDAGDAETARKKLVEAFEKANRIEFSVYWDRSEERTKVRLGPVIVDDPETLNRIRTIVTTTIEEVHLNPTRFEDPLVGVAGHITLVQGGRVKLARLATWNYLDFFADERWTARLTTPTQDSSLFQLLLDIAREASGRDVRLIYETNSPSSR